MKVGIYCRVSGSDQKDNTSLENQKDSGVRFCDSNGYDYEVFSEVVSGGKDFDERLAFNDLSTKLFDGEINAIWIWDFTRGRRDDSMKYLFVQIIKETKCKVFVGGVEKDILSDEGMLEMGMFSLISDFERKKILRRMKDGRNRRWKEGKGLGRIGFGFDNNNGEVFANEIEKDVVVDIYKFFLYKNVKKYGDCERYLIKKYGREVNGKRLDSGLVSRTLGNKKYNGKLIYNTQKDGIFEFDLEKFIDDDTFKKVEEKLKYVKGVRSINSKEIYILKGLVHCGDCDRKMWIEGSGKIVNGKSYRYFKCSSYKENEKLRRRQLDELDKFNCVSGSRGNKISKDKLDSVVWKCLFKVLSNSEIIINEYKKRFAENLGSKDRFVSKLEYYKKELTKLDIRKNKMINMVLDVKFSEDDYEKWFDNEYEEKKIEINSKLDLVKVEVGKYGYVDKIENWMDLMKEDLIRDFNIERKEDKRRIVERYIEKVFVNEIGDIDNERRFEINLILRLGKKKGKIQFDYDIKEKSLNLKLIEKDFYIVNNDFVKSPIIVYKNELLISIKLCVKYNKSGRYELEVDELISECVDF